ncbi:MAG: serine/threonine-protein kinase [Kofleriaceae bacterium]
MTRGKTRRISPDRIGEYRIEKQLTTTSAYAVYQAIHRVLPRRAVIKVMFEPVFDPVAAPVQVLREACMLELLHHPGVVRIYEAGLLPDRRAWLAHELIEGTATTSLLEPGAMDRIDAIALLRDIAEVLDHAHSRGVVHGGLFPDRIVLTGLSRGFPLCIADWSDVRAHDASPIPHVPTTMTWHYSAPELAAGEAIDDRADVFSLGVIGYELLTGQLPSRVQIATSEHERSHALLEQQCPDAPPELTSLVDRMLSYDPKHRPTSAEIHEELLVLTDRLGSVDGPHGASIRIRQPKWTPPLRFDPAHDQDRTNRIERRMPRSDEEG